MVIVCLVMLSSCQINWRGKRVKSLTCPGKSLASTNERKNREMTQISGFYSVLAESKSWSMSLTQSSSLLIMSQILFDQVKLGQHEFDSWWSGETCLTTGPSQNCDSASQTRDSCYMGVKVLLLLVPESFTLKSALLPPWESVNAHHYGISGQ